MENYCKNCGAKLSTSDQFCRECGTKTEKINFCQDCGAELTDSSNFCENCGTKLQTTQTFTSKFKSIEPKHRNIIIALLAIIGILIVATAIITTNSPSDDSLELERYDFGVVSMDVPKGSSFHEYDSVGKGTQYWAIGYENSLEDNDELFMVWIGNYDSSDFYSSDFVERDGDLDVYEPLGGSYMIQRQVGEYYIQIDSIGGDLDNLKQIARSIEVEN